MQEKASAPDIRFVGFADDWAQKQFENIAVRASSISDKAGLPRVEYEDIISGIGQLNKDVNLKDSNKSGVEFQEGDVLYGKLRPYLKNWLLPSFAGLAVGDFWVLQPQNADSSFLYRLIQSQKFDEVANQSTGTKMPRADWKLVSKTDFFIPDSIHEQREIGTFFCHFDNLIAFRQRKYRRLCNIKKAMLEKMFPKDGASIPEIRFVGFTDAWERRKLGEMGTTYTGLAGKTKDDFGHGFGRFVTYMNVFSNPVASPDAVEPIEIDTAQNEVRLGDVFFTTSSETPEEVGMSSVWLENSENTYLNSFCFGYRMTEKIDPYYLAYMLRSAPARKRIALLAQGISRYNISKNKMMDIEVCIPTLEEQQKVGAYFRYLDNLIALHQRKLERLQNIKKSYLKKMFV